MFLLNYILNKSSSINGIISIAGSSYGCDFLIAAIVLATFSKLHTTSSLSSDIYSVSLFLPIYGHALSFGLNVPIDCVFVEQ